MNFHSFQIQTADQDFVPNINIGKQRAYKRWSIQENFKYICFLKKEINNFSSQRDRRVLKVFKRLAEEVETKDQSQCKSHHQKMIKQYKKIEQIIDHFSQIFNKAKKLNSVPNNLKPRKCTDSSEEFSYRKIQQSPQKQNERSNEQEELFNVLDLNSTNRHA